MWDLPRAETEPMSPTLAGGFLTTGPPEKLNSPPQPLPFVILKDWLFQDFLLIIYCLLFPVEWFKRDIYETGCVFSLTYHLIDFLIGVIDLTLGYFRIT